jgi:hypothetical protein
MANFTIKVVGDLTLAKTRQEIARIKTTLMSEVRTEVAGRTPIDTGQARRGWQQRNTTTVENSVPYIGKLEKGYSRQAPNGFVRQGITAAIGKVTKGK